MSRVILRPRSEALKTSNGIIMVSSRRCIATVQPAALPPWCALRVSRPPPTNPSGCHVHGERRFDDARREAVVLGRASDLDPHGPVEAVADVHQRRDDGVAVCGILRLDVYHGASPRINGRSSSSQGEIGPLMGRHPSFHVAYAHIGIDPVDEGGQGNWAEAALCLREEHHVHSHDGGWPTFQRLRSSQYV
eukprot:4787315-Pyramimonas_sp.AAC.1